MIRAAHWLEGRWSKPKPQLPQGVTPYDDPALLQGAVERWLANKRMIEVIAKGFGVRTIFVWQPAPTYKYDLHYHLFVQFLTEAQRNTRRCSYGYPLMENLWEQGKLGPDVLWLADIQQDKRENLYVDNVHYNAAFSKEIAAQIYSFLRESLGEPQGPQSRNVRPGAPPNALFVGRESDASPRDPLGPNVRPQRFRNHHAPIRLLIIFHDRHPRTADRQSAAVQRVHEFGFVLPLWPIPDIGPPRLVRLEIRARRNLAKQLLPRQPHFNVVRLCR
jgi:hypothetical protein